MEQLLIIYLNKLRNVLNRGYYMAARRYEMSLRKVNNISRVSAAIE